MRPDYKNLVDQMQVKSVIWLIFHFYFIISIIRYDNAIC